jgi:hypothetical protein
MNKASNISNEIRDKVITQGRAYVRLIEATDLLLTGHLAWTERLLLRLVHSLYTHRLRGLVGELPPEISAEILAASEKIKGPIGEISRN